MANNNFMNAKANQTSACRKKLVENQKAMDKVDLNIKCDCVHRDRNGAYALNPPQGNNPEKNPFTGKAYYRCRECEKKLDISQIPPEDFNKAKDTIDRTIDIGKMHLDLSSEKDRNLLEALSKFQYQLHTLLPDIHKAICNGGRKKKKAHNPYSGMVSVGR